MRSSKTLRKLVQLVCISFFLFLAPFATTFLIAAMWLVKALMTKEPTRNARGVITLLCAFLLCLASGLFSAAWCAPAVFLPGVGLLAWLFWPDQVVEVVPRYWSPRCVDDYDAGMIDVTEQCSSAPSRRRRKACSGFIGRF